MSTRTSLVVLATGTGRDGSPDVPALLQPVGRSSVLALTILHAIATEWPLVVVTSAPLAAPLARWIATRDIVVLDAGALAGGRGRAIAAGVAAHAGADGWVVLPAGRPLVQPATLRAIGQALAEHPVAYAQHQGRPGEPTGFAAELFSELIALDGDDGPRRLRARYPALGVEVDDAGVLLDVSSREGLSRARAALADAA